MKEQLLKTSGAYVLSSRRKRRKTLGGGWHSTTPFPQSPCTSEGGSPYIIKKLLLTSNFLGDLTNISLERCQ